MIRERIEKFEDLIAWQRARGLTKRIYEVTRQGEFQRDFSLRDQIRRASVSVMSNISPLSQKADSSVGEHPVYIRKVGWSDSPSAYQFSLKR